MRNKDRTKTTFPPPPTSPQSQLHSLTFYLLPRRMSQGWVRNGCWGQSLTLLLWRSFFTLLILQELLQHGSVPQGTVLQEWTALAWVPQGLYFRPENLLLCGFSMGYIFLQTIATCCGIRSSMGCSVDICSDVVFPMGYREYLLHRGLLHGLQGDNLLHHGLLHACWGLTLVGSQALHSQNQYNRLQGNLCSGTWSTSSPSFFTDFGVCRIVSLTFFSFLSLTAIVQWILPFVKYVFREVPPASLFGSALSRGGSLLELAGTSSVLHSGRQPLVPSNRGYLCSLLITKILPRKTNRVLLNRLWLWSNWGEILP